MFSAFDSPGVQGSREVFAFLKVMITIRIVNVILFIAVEFCCKVRFGLYQLN